MPTTDDLAALLVERAERCAPDRHSVLAVLDEYENLEHARTVTVLARTPRRRLHRVLATAAAVVAAVGVGVGVNTVYSRSDNTTGAGATAITACRASLPAAWQHALDNGRIALPGEDTQPLAVTNGGRVILSWTDARGELHVGRLSRGRPIDPLAQVAPPAGTKIGTVAADSRHAVVSFYRHDHTSAIDLLDLVTGRTQHLLANAPLADTARAFGGSWLTIQHATVYWPASRPHNTAPNVLVSYNIATSRYRTKLVPGDAVYLNAMGIYWQGGHLTKQQLPASHPPLDQRYMSVATDADAVAWSLYTDAATVTWSDRTGAARSVRQNLARSVSIDAVAGPYVFLDRGEGDNSDVINGNVQVLDTRTGAIADTGTRQWLPATSSSGTLVFATLDRNAAMRVVDVTDLPELHCG